MTNATYISCSETATLIRVELKKYFPGVKFAVRSSQYSMGASIMVQWQDGPTDAEVKKVIGYFAGATFDGLTDSTTYHTVQFQGQLVRFGADYVFTRRRFSVEFLAKIRDRACFEDSRAKELGVYMDSGHAYFCSARGIDSALWNRVRELMHTMRADGLVVRVK